MRSCILLVYITVLAAGTVILPAAARIRGQELSSDPDALYARREDPAAARRAEEIWAGAVKHDPKDFEAAWKLSQVRYWIAQHMPQDDRARKVYEQGVAAAEMAIAAEPNRPHGYFWKGANMGMLGESFGIMAGLKYRKPIKEALEKSAAIDPSYRQGSALRALGRWYCKVPGLFGGDKKKSLEYLNKALAHNPNSTITHYFLAETYVEMGKKAEAKAELQKVLELPSDPEFAPEDKDYKAKAKELIKKEKLTLERNLILGSRLEPPTFT